nr:PREDICTED: uncharacterized protein LOC109637679 [Paralichthys olivaceus]
MPRGSTTTTCVGCKAVIAVATKTCKSCQSEQPRKLRLAKKLQRFEAIKEGWLENQKKNKTTSHVIDEASVLLEKLHTLGHRAVMFHAKPGKTPAAWFTRVLQPKWQLSDQAEKCLDMMKALYEVLIHDWSNQHPSTHQPSTIPANQPPTIQPTTTPLNQPSTSPDMQPPSDKSAQKKRRKNKEGLTGECNNSVSGGEKYHPVKRVLKSKRLKGNVMKLME